MLYAKQINTREKYYHIVDNKMDCPIIFISKDPPPKKFLNKLIVINK